MSSSKTYWEARTAENEKFAQKVEKDFLKQQKSYYKQLSNEIDNKITELYSQMLKAGEISNTQLYSFGRYANFKKMLNKKCGKIKDKQIDDMYNALAKIYKETFSKSYLEGRQPIKWGLAEESLLKQCLTSEWSGKNFSKRIWKNTDDLTYTLDKVLKDTIASGGSLIEVKKKLHNELNVAYSRASTLVRTESMFTLNQACKDRYKQAGIVEYEFLSAHDSRTSEECSKLDGKHFLFSEAEVGVNYPPVHPNCRSTIIPIVKKFS